MPALQNWSPTVVPASYLGRAQSVHLKQAYIYFTARVKRDPALQLVARDADPGRIRVLPRASNHKAGTVTRLPKLSVGCGSAEHILRLATCEHLQPVMLISDARFDLGNQRQAFVGRGNGMGFAAGKLLLSEDLAPSSSHRPFHPNPFLHVRNKFPHFVFSADGGHPLPI